MKQTNLVSDLSSLSPAIVDPLLVNPWGVSHSPTSPFWVSDAGSKVSTLYAVNPTTGAVTKSSLVVSTPAPPSGQVFNGVATDFIVTSGAASGPALFIFAELNGTIAGWSPNVPPPPPSTHAQLAATGSAPAVYTGIALGMRPSATTQFLYAANPAGGRIDVYDHTFTKVTTPGHFTDPNLPTGDAPFNVANIGGRLFVSYTGPVGAINVFDTDGNFLRRFATGGTLLNPWGMVVAPSTFGRFANKLLVGNFNRGNPANGPGYISAFELEIEDGQIGGGEFEGLLRGTDGKPVTIDGLWALIFGNGGSGGSPDVLYFAAGIQNEAHGLFGSLTSCHGPTLSNVSATPSTIPQGTTPVNVAIGYSVADNCDSAPVCSLSVSRDGGEGDGHGNSGAATILGPHAIEVTPTAGRFNVMITCQDTMGLASKAKLQVIVANGKH